MACKCSEHPGAFPHLLGEYIGAATLRLMMLGVKLPSPALHGQLMLGLRAAVIIVEDPAAHGVVADSELPHCISNLGLILLDQVASAADSSTDTLRGKLLDLVVRVLDTTLGDARAWMIRDASIAAEPLKHEIAVLERLLPLAKSAGGSETGSRSGHLDGSTILAIVNGWIRTEPIRAKLVCQQAALRQALIDITLNAGSDRVRFWGEQALLMLVDAMSGPADAGFAGELAAAAQGAVIGAQSQQQALRACRILDAISAALASGPLSFARTKGIREAFWQGPGCEPFIRLLEQIPEAVCRGPPGTTGRAVEQPLLQLSQSLLNVLVGITAGDSKAIQRLDELGSAATAKVTTPAAETAAEERETDGGGGGTAVPASKHVLQRTPSDISLAPMPAASARLSEGGYSRIVTAVLGYRTSAGHFRARMDLILWVIMGSLKLRPGSTPCNVFQNVWCAKALITCMPLISKLVAEDGELHDAAAAASPSSVSNTIVGAIERLAALCLMSMVNATRCCRAGLTGACISALEQWPHVTVEQRKAMVQLLVDLGKHSMDRATSKALLQHVSVSSPRFNWQTALPLQWAAIQLCKGDKQPAHFDLDGLDSQIEIPNVTGLNHGYTFHTWMRIESLSPAVPASRSQVPARRGKRCGQGRVFEYTAMETNAKHEPSNSKSGGGGGGGGSGGGGGGGGGGGAPSKGYEPRLLRLHARGTLRMEVFLTAGRLAIRVMLGVDAVATHVFSDAKVPVQQWFCLTLVHSKARALGTPEFKVFFNGALQEKVAMKFPAGLGSPVNATVGNGESRPNSLRQNTCLRAQLATIYLMQPASDASVEGLHSLGLNYTGCFEAHTLDTGKIIDSLADGGGSDSDPKSSHVASSLSKKVVAWCHPKAVDESQGTARNIAAYIDGPRSPPVPDAILSCDTYPNQCATEAMGLDGGACTAVLAMRMPADLAVPARSTDEVDRELTARPTLDEVCAMTANLPYPVLHVYVSQGLELVLQLLRSHPGIPNVPDDERCRAVAMAAILLEETSIAQLPSLCVKLVAKLIATKPGVVSSISPALSAALDYFVFNFELWSIGTPAAQVAHSELVVQVVRRNKGFVSGEFGINHFLRALQLYNTSSDFHRTLRAKLLEVLDVCATQALGHKDIELILSFIRKCSEPIVATDIAEWIRVSIQAWLMRVQQQDDAATVSESAVATGKVLEAALCSDGPPFELYACASRPSGTVRASILWTIASLCSSSKMLGDEGRASLRLEKVGFAGIVAMFTAADNTKEVIEAMVAIGTCQDKGGSADLGSAPSNASAPTSPLRTADPDVITSHPEYLSPPGKGSARRSLGGDANSDGSDREGGASNISPDRPIGVRGRTGSGSSSGSVRSRSGSKSGKLPTRRSLRKGGASYAKVISTTDSYLDTPASIGQVGISRRVVCPAALDAALRLVSEGNVEQDNGGIKQGRDGSNITSSDDERESSTATFLDRYGGKESLEAAAAAAAVGKKEDTATYAFELVEKILQVGDSAFRFSEVVGWEQAILLALHSKRILSTPIVKTTPGLAGKPLTTDSLRMLHHPRIGAVVSMLHAVIWAKFKVDSSYLAFHLPSTFDCIEAELSAIHYSLAHKHDINPATAAAEAGANNSGELDSAAFPSSSELKMWLLAKLLESLAAQWTMIVFGDSDMESLSAFMTTLAEELLYSNDGTNEGGQTTRQESEAIWSFRVVLSLALLRFSSACGAEFKLRGPAPLGDETPKEGVLEVNMRVTLTTLLSLDQLPEVSLAETMASTVAEWLLRFRLEPSAEVTLTADRALYIIWHLASQIKMRSHAEHRTKFAPSVAILVGVFRKFLKWWWWCLSPSLTWGHDTESEVEPLSGPTDPRLNEGTNPEVIETMVKSSWWEELSKRKLRPATEKVIDADHILVLPAASPQRNSSTGAADEAAAARRALADSSGRSFVQGTVLTRISRADKNHTQSEQRHLSHRAQHCEAARLHLQSWERALLRPLGVFGPDLSSLSNNRNEGGDILGASTGKWKMDTTEDFSRIRKKCAPVYGNFDIHTVAADARDNRTGSRRRGDDWDAKKVEEADQSLANDLNAPVVLPLIATANSVQFMSTTSGVVEVTPTSISFLAHSSSDSGSSKLFDRPDFEIPLKMLREMHARRFNLRHTALEFFSVDQTNHLINFGSTALRDKVYHCIKDQDTPALIYAGLRDGAKLLAKSPLTKRWQQRKISNFEYLMQLNTLAGRTYNDLNQYPVFPWVLADYTSDVLDLNNPASFRDLSKPAGAMNEERCEMLRMMYEGNDDPVMGRFHYGTHYSNAAYVLHYLLRIEPFTSLHIDLQSGKFDHADRQFISFAETWKSIFSGSSDVKELIPEMFYLPEALQNLSGFNLGELQNGRKVGDVELPPWASTAHEFIRLHRAALESEHVSQHLHQWIDLIFGYKQTGPAAEEAVNCFLRSSYEGNVDLDSYEDPRERKAMEDMIRELGQTPSQLLTAPHPPRKPLEAKDVPPVWKLKKAYFVELATNDPVAAVLLPSRSDAVAEWMKSGLAMKLITLSEQGLTAVHDWLPSTASGRGSSSRPFTLDADPAVRRSERSRAGSGMLEVGRRRNTRLLALAPDNITVLMAGSWDGTVKLLKVASANQARVVVTRNSNVLPSISTCVALDADGETVVVGCKDGTTVVFRLRLAVVNRRGAGSPDAPLSPGPGDVAGAASSAGGSAKRRVNYTLEGPTHVFYGHSAEVTQVIVDTEVDMILTCSRDGTVNMHTIGQPKYVRTLKPSPPRPEGTEAAPQMSGSLEMIASTFKTEVVATYGCWRGGGRKRVQALHAYNINGQLLATDVKCGSLVELVGTQSGNFFIAAKRKGFVSVRNAYNLETIYAMSTNHVSIRSMSVSSNESHLLIALEDGKLVIVPSA